MPVRRVRISRIALEGLFGRLDIDVPITENKIVLAGVNGIGKSTFINILYHFISLQWSGLLHYDFASISVELNGKAYAIRKEEIEQFESLTETFGKLPVRYRRVLERLTAEGHLETFVTNRLLPEQYSYYSGILNLPRSELDHMRAFLKRRLDESADLFTDKARSLLDAFRQEVTARILYLPTYRRIERDLSFIFPGLEEEINRYQRRSTVSGRHADHYLELVSFGMEDVQDNIGMTLAKLKDEARTTMNGLAAIYLRDVIRGEAAEFDRSVIAALNDADVASILDRVEERTLSEQDKATLRDVISQLQKRSRGRLKADQKYIAHFFSRLVEAANVLKSKEAPIRQFVDFLQSLS